LNALYELDRREQPQVVRNIEALYFLSMRFLALLLVEGFDIQLINATRRYMTSLLTAEIGNRHH